MDGMVRRPIGLEIPSLPSGRHEQPRVVPRAAVPDARPRALGRAVARRPEGGDGDRASAEQPPDGGDVDRLPGVGGAHHRDLVVGDIRLTHRGEGDRALQRFLAGTTEEHPIRVAGERSEAPSASQTATSPVCTDSTRPLRTTWTSSAGAVIGAEA